LNFNVKEKQVDAWSLCNEMMEDQSELTLCEGIMHLVNPPLLLNFSFSKSQPEMTRDDADREMTQDAMPQIWKLVTSPR